MIGCEKLFLEFKKALSLGVHPRRINEIVLGKRPVTAETALRLARYFGTIVSMGTPLF